MNGETPELQALEEAVARRLSDLSTEHDLLVTQLAVNSLGQARCKSVLALSERIRQLSTIPERPAVAGSLVG